MWYQEINSRYHFSCIFNFYLQPQINNLLVLSSRWILLFCNSNKMGQEAFSLFHLERKKFLFMVLPLPLYTVDCLLLLDSENLNGINVVDDGSIVMDVYEVDGGGRWFAGVMCV